jgi:hypothetical protein
VLKPKAPTLDTAHVARRQDSPLVASATRFAALLGCLGAATIVLLGRIGLFRAAGFSSHRTQGAAASWCVPGGLPPLARVDVNQLLALRVSLTRVIAPLGGRRYAGGITVPQDMWSDNSPQTPDSARSAQGTWPGGYEMRWWTPGGADVAADALAFADPAQARSFFKRASGVGCHHDAIQPPPLWLRHGRNLVWVNPDDVTEYDAFLQRGRLVYRVVVVSPPPTHGHRLRHPERAGVYGVDALACTLPDANCYASPNRHRANPRRLV